MDEIVKSLKARMVFDSRGKPTIEAQAMVKKHVISSIAPSGASTGIHEAFELRDSKIPAFFGQG